MNWLNNWIYYKYHTALSVLGLFVYTASLFGGSSLSLALLLFFSAHLFYLWGSGRMLGSIKRSFWFAVLWGCEFVLVCYFLLSIGKAQQSLNFLFLGMMALWYYKPLFFRVRIRYVPGIKVFWIALLWTGVLYQFFLLSNARELEELSWRVICHFWGIFFFIVAITIPFDIRDFHTDPLSLNTLPRLLGLRNAKRIAILFLAFFEVLRFFVVFDFRGWFFYILTCFSVLYVFLMIYFSDTKRSYRYYSLGVEFSPMALTLNFLLIEYLFV